MRLVNNISSSSGSSSRTKAEAEVEAAARTRAGAANEVQNMRIIQKIVLNPLMAAAKRSATIAGITIIIMRSVIKHQFQ